jgi:hypothetical protein
MTSPLPPIIEVRRFSDEAIQKVVDKALLGASSDSRFGVVAHADLQRFVAVARYKDGPWSVAGFLDKPWDGKLTAGAELRFEL